MCLCPEEIRYVGHWPYLPPPKEDYTTSDSCKDFTNYPISQMMIYFLFFRAWLNMGKSVPQKNTIEGVICVFIVVIVRELSINSRTYHQIFESQWNYGTIANLNPNYTSSRLLKSGQLNCLSLMNNIKSSFVLISDGVAKSISQSINHSFTIKHQIGSQPINQ